MNRQIEAAPPVDWRDLEERAARILADCGMETLRAHKMATVRGEVVVDVHAVDPTTTPQTTIIVECKNWRKRVPKTVVHAFRTVLGDTGVNLGLLLSAAGFQSGALEAAAHSNIRLLDWRAFEEMFVERWRRDCMVPKVLDQAEPLLEYTEPVNFRIFPHLEALPPTKQARFSALQDKHLALAYLLTPWSVARFLSLRPTSRVPSPDRQLEALTLPLREYLPVAWVGADGDRLVQGLPEEVLDANALRPLLDALLASIRAAIAEFDEVFGGRA